MAVTTLGKNDFAAAFMGDTFTPFNAANARLCVGDSTTAFAVGQTDLQAAANKSRKGMDATYPIRAGNILTYKASFGATEANFAWQEWGLAKSASAADMVQRKVESLGTKPAGEIWALTATLTVG